MDHPAKELLLARIASGVIRLKLSGEKFLLKKPSRIQLYRAQEVYQEVRQEALAEGLYDEVGLLKFMLDEGLWTEHDQGRMDALPKEIEEFKLQLFQSDFRSNDREFLRKAIAQAKGEMEKLFLKRHSYDGNSCDGQAARARARYLIACGLVGPRGKKVFRDPDCLRGPCEILDQAVETYAVERVGETELRELARTEPFRSLWASRKSEKNLFGGAAADYTEEQRGLSCWASLYDSIGEHPDCPSDEIINDDDRLDGWLIFQRREREKRFLASQADKLANKDADEIYLMAQTVEDARRIDKLNSPMASAIKAQRAKVLAEKGTVNELEMPDTKNRMRMEAAQKLRQAMKG